ncbi:Non-reducing end beta-L-arabinofuranosidase [Phycisphaerales bacterium]|nr:Non-reducing end beta-L-arabinofuranosidase [Phycisphaerales bacterium]
MLPILAALLLAQPQPVPFTNVTFTDDFWAPRQKINAAATLDQNFTQCESTGRIANLKKAGEGAKGGFQGYFFNDSDVFKAVEGAAYVYATTKDRDLRKRMDAIVDTIVKAQQPDGYLDSYFIIEKPDDKWSNLKDMHELYCAGHLIEAGIAHHQATGERTLLDAAVKLADLIDNTFGPAPKRPGVCGHPEIELALVRLYRHTGQQRYLDLARYFVRARGDVTQGRRDLYGEYAQDHMPLVEQTKVAGHAVRAMYLYSAATDLASIDRRPDDPMVATLDNLWDNLTLRKMYLTGGIGNSSSNEGFTRDFDLPNDTAYAETCAGIGLIMWAHRMNLLHDESRYIDVMELSLYNAALSGISQDGRSFFYVNPMSSKGQHARQPWYSCACCPPNILRLIASLGGYVATTHDAPNPALTLNLYAGCNIRTEVNKVPVRVEVDTRYPWDGQVNIRVRPQHSTRFTLRLRVPGWAESVKVSAGGGPITPAPEQKSGYLEINRAWTDDQITLEFLITPRTLVADPRIAAARGHVAFARGPLIYCFESIDQPATLSSLFVNTARGLTSQWDAKLGLNTLHAWGNHLSAQPFDDNPYVTVARGDEIYLTAVPYYSWANRSKPGTPAEMMVWMPSSDAVAAGSRPSGPTASASHTWHSDSTDALSDGLVGNSSSAADTPRHTWWPRKGSEEWVRYDFTSTREIIAVRVYWFDDSSRGGGCALPASWRVEYLDGAVWQECELLPGNTYAAAADAFNSVRFKPVTTTAVRVVAKLAAANSAGIIEWEVDSHRASPRLAPNR